MKKALISYKKISKLFGKQEILRDFDLKISRGEIFSIIGPSGIGKTVTIKMLIGLLMPDKGDLMFDGQNLANFPRDEDFLPIRRRIAMVFQGVALFDSMSVFDNIAYPLKEQLDLSESEIEDLVVEKLSWVGLKEAKEKMPAELSGGMKKRVALARSIATDPEVILYDEPTAGLDPVNTIRVVDLILSLQQRLKCTSIVVTHDIAAAEKLSEKAGFMYDKKLGALGSFDELRASEHAYVREFLAGVPNLA